jgi:hypothetical protein
VSSAFPHIAATETAYQLFASAEPDPEAWQALKAQGVNLDYVTNLVGPIVRTPASFSSDGRFAHDSFGKIAFALAVHADDAETVIDFVAYVDRNSRKQFRLQVDAHSWAFQERKSYEHS